MNHIALPFRKSAIAPGSEAELKGRLGLLAAELRRLGQVAEANALDAGQ